jgi:hypothetical protein
MTHEVGRGKRHKGCEKEASRLYLKMYVGGLYHIHDEVGSKPYGLDGKGNVLEAGADGRFVDATKTVRKRNHTYVKVGWKCFECGWQEIQHRKPSRPPKIVRVCYVCNEELKGQNTRSEYCSVHRREELACAYHPRLPAG